jgi:hypothetical protein
MWSFERWNKRKRYTTWAIVLAAGASASSITTALAKDPDIAWIGAILGFLTAAVSAYERHLDPTGTAAKHVTAQKELELLTSKFRDFIERRATQLSEDEADTAFDALEIERQELIRTLIEVEPEAREAVKRG